MKWGLGMIAGACLALVLGMAVVAPSTSRGAGPVPQPSDSVLEESRAPRTGAGGRSLVEERPPGSRADAESGKGQHPSPDPDDERLEAIKALREARSRN